MKTKPRINLTGHTYGKYTVLSQSDDAAKPSGIRVITWTCKCQCGQIRTVRGGDLRSGSTLSCGCYQREFTAKRKTTHGGSGTPEWRSYQGMLFRCTNRDAKDYPRYGGRGITVCPEWKVSFTAFLADMGERPKGTTLDRINTDGNYEPKNCRWATAKQQSRNRRNTHYIEINGERLNAAEAAEKAGISYHALKSRARRGWDAKRILEPSHRN
jgi:hypothetical protein